MVKRAMLSALAAWVLGACTETSILSNSVYEHQQRAYELESRGEHQAADAQRAAAEKDRYKLARIGNSAGASYPRL